MKIQELGAWDINLEKKNGRIKLNLKKNYSKFSNAAGMHYRFSGFEMNIYQIGKKYNSNNFSGIVKE
ncbi:hypothetical protein BpHYR1_026030 [Brachionus plicatilis]|uniref:Uncharacterized protein n=1 Tax=Brachionus plicatilis TaxID=10195 RepID=A0A3M7PZH8_BRAPC|nr:hypothetical protein BpHYR1_026030 [Brachionus plicatilis]